jgi:hypothetical protein
MELKELSYAGRAGQESRIFPLPVPLSSLNMLLSDSLNEK